MTLISTVVGYTTSSTAQLLGIFDSPSAGTARLAYRDGSGVHAPLDVPISSAPPYGLAKFRVDDLTGDKVSYAVADFGPGAAPPDPVALLASTGAKTFRTVAPGPLRVGLVSCNDVDTHAFPKAERAALWRRLAKLVEDGEVDLLVHAGDQIYGDAEPPGWSPREGRTAAYRRHYVQTWSHPDVAAVLGSCPNLMMWDDHEIYDGWGSNDNDVTAAAQARYQAAEEAFKEFQDPLNSPDRIVPGLGWVAKFGELAILAVDGRSQR